MHMPIYGGHSVKSAKTAEKGGGGEGRFLAPVGAGSCRRGEAQAFQFAAGPRGAGTTIACFGSGQEGFSVLFNAAETVEKLGIHWHAVMPAQAGVLQKQGVPNARLPPAV